MLFSFRKQTIPKKFPWLSIDLLCDCKTDQNILGTQPNPLFIDQNITKYDPPNKSNKQNQQQ